VPAPTVVASIAPALSPPPDGRAGPLGEQQWWAVLGDAASFGVRQPHWSPRGVADPKENTRRPRPAHDAADGSGRSWRTPPSSSERDSRHLCGYRQDRSDARSPSSLPQRLSMVLTHQFLSTQHKPVPGWPAGSEPDVPHPQHRCPSFPNEALGRPTRSLGSDPQRRPMQTFPNGDGSAVERDGPPLKS
jgi:hypothetical protein